MFSVLIVQVICLLKLLRKCQSDVIVNFLPSFQLEQE